MTYAELQQQIAGFLNRDDLTDQIPTFIALAEAKLLSEVRTWWGIAPEIYGGEDVIELPDLPALANDNQTNWLLSRAPGAYLYGSLIHTAPYLAEDARIEPWGVLYRSAMDSLQQENTWAKHHGRLVMQSPAQKRASNA